MSFKSLKDDREHKKDNIMLNRKGGKRRSNSAPSLHKNGVQDVNETDVKGRTSLFYASKYGEIEIVRHLLSRGADPDIPDRCSNYPLHEAVDNMHLDIVKLLCKYGCNLNCQNLYGQTPLMRAVSFGDLESVKMLIKLGAHVDNTDCTGKSALLIGLQEGHDKVCSCLIKLGCDVSIVDQLGQSALFLAVHRTSSPASLAICQKLFRAGYDPETDSDWLSKDLYKQIINGTGLFSRFMHKLGFKSSKISLNDHDDYSDDYIDITDDSLSHAFHERSL